MRRSLARAVAAACLVIGGALTLPSPGSCAETGDVQDLFFFGGKEAILVRLHIRIDDRPLNTAWHDAVAALHEYLDNHGAGTVARDEELPDLAPIVRVPLGIRPQLPSRSQPDAAFTRIDASGDGALDAGEQDGAGQVLLRLDRNDDESISRAELEPLRVPDPVAMAPALEEAGKVETLVLVLDRNGSRIRMVQQVMTRLDTGGAGARAKDHRLGRSEIRLAADVFRKFDGNRDGALDSTELMDVLDQSVPNVELDVRLGARSPGRPALALRDGGGLVKLRRNGAAALTIDLGDAWVDIRAEETAWDSERARRAFDEAFQDIDLDDSKSLTVSEARGREPFDRLFRLMDRNGDGRVVKQEMSAALGLIEDLWRGHAELAVVDRGVQLFANLDTSGDGRLGLRELRSAGRELAAFDRNGDGRLAAAEVPRRFEWSFSQAPLPLGLLLASGPDRAPSTPPAADAAAGPHWFQEMDRNRDGDLSPREFVGPSAVFKGLDADRDGLIDAREAAAAAPRRPP